MCNLVKKTEANKYVKKFNIYNIQSDKTGFECAVKNAYISVHAMSEPITQNMALQ